MAGYMAPRCFIGTPENGIQLQLFGVKFPEDKAENGLVRIKDADVLLDLFLWRFSGEDERSVTLMTHMGAWVLKTTGPIGVFRVDLGGDVIPLLDTCSCEPMHQQQVLRSNPHLRMQDQDWIAIEYEGSYTEKFYLPKPAKD